MFKELNPEVLVADVPILTIGREGIAELKARAARNRRQRVRVCAHRHSDDIVHEMLIVMTQGCYIRPHKHLGKGESFHIIDGAIDVVMFDDSGRVTNVLALGDYASGRHFYFRGDDMGYHTVSIRSPLVVLHETTRGPFRAADNIAAPWSPEETATKAVADFLRRMHDEVQRHLVSQ